MHRRQENFNSFLLKLVIHRRQDLFNSFLLTLGIQLRQNKLIHYHQQLSLIVDKKYY